MRSNIAGSSLSVRTGRPASGQQDTADEALIEKIAAGNRLAMQALFARHHARVYRFLVRILGDNALAEDVTSDVFLSVWRQADRFRGRSAVTTWLLAIARYKALAELRRRPDTLSDEESADHTDPTDDP